jgi:hypothetical protein
MGCTPGAQLEAAWLGGATLQHAGVYPTTFQGASLAAPTSSTRTPTAPPPRGAKADTYTHRPDTWGRAWAEAADVQLGYRD